VVVPPSVPPAQVWPGPSRLTTSVGLGEASGTGEQADNNQGKSHSQFSVLCCRVTPASLLPLHFLPHDLVDPPVKPPRLLPARVRVSFITMSSGVLVRAADVNRLADVAAGPLLVEPHAPPAPPGWASS